MSQALVLNNGVKIPSIGLGTYRMWGQRAVKAISWALNAGYRHIDTAMVYSNEKRVGEAIRLNDIPRDDIFITTKLWNTDHGYQATKKAIDTSLNKLKLDYVDLYLIHWPVEGFTETWDTMIDIQNEGKARSIGVSNFMLHHLDELLESTNVVPAINQVECTPYFIRRKLLEYCSNRGITISAYSPLTRGMKLSDPRLVSVAKRYEKSPAQILIRWGLQHGLVEIPKSRQENRIIENISVFDFTLSEDDMDTLDSLNENLRVYASAGHKELAERYLD